QQATERTRALLDEVQVGRLTADANERKAADYFAAYMDEAAVEKRGLSAIKPALDRIAAISDRHALARELGALLRADVDPLNATNLHTDRLFGLWVAQDLNDPAHNTAYLLQGGLAMPDREYYLADNAHMTEVRAKYRAHVAAVLKLAAIADAESQPDQ